VRTSGRGRRRTAPIRRLRCRRGFRGRRCARRRDPSEQHRLQIGLDRFEALRGLVTLLGGVGAHRRVPGELVGRGAIGFRATVRIVARGHRIDLGALLRPRAEAFEVARRVFGREQRVELGEPGADLVETNA